MSEQPEGQERFGEQDQKVALDAYKVLVGQGLRDQGWDGFALGFEKLGREEALADIRIQQEPKRTNQERQYCEGIRIGLVKERELPDVKNKSLAVQAAFEKMRHRHQVMATMEFKLEDKHWSREEAKEFNRQAAEKEGGMENGQEEFFSKEEAQAQIGKKVILMETDPKSRLSGGSEGRIVEARETSPGKFSVGVEWPFEKGQYDERVGKVQVYSKSRLEKETQVEKISPERLKERFAMEARMEKFAQKLEGKAPERPRGLDGPSR